MSIATGFSDIDILDIYDSLSIRQSLQNQGAQYVDRDFPVDLKGTVDRLRDINNLAYSIQCKSSE